MSHFDFLGRNLNLLTPSGYHQQIGGFIPCDTGPNKMLTRILSFLAPIEQAGYDPNYIQTVMDAFERCYDYLLNQYNDQSDYSQRFRKTNGSIIANDHVQLKKYHVNYAALIFINFLVELQMFYLTHKGIQNTKRDIRYNKPTQMTNNNLQSWWKQYQSNTQQFNPTRVYKHVPINVLNNQLNGALTDFCQGLETIFREFLDTFVDKLTVMANKLIKPNVTPYTSTAIYRLIVPYEDHRIQGQLARKYEFIYHDWKQRLATDIRGKMDLLTGNQPRFPLILSRISHEIRDLIEDVVNTEHPYIGEATGFFSWKYMANINKLGAKYYGCCMTYSLIEFYLLSRLHIHPDNYRLSLQMENPHIEHILWIYTQRHLRPRLTSAITGGAAGAASGTYRGVTHWATLYKTGPQSQIIFRDVPHYYHHDAFRFTDSRKDFLRAFIYPIVDSYVGYWNYNLQLGSVELDQHEVTYLNQQSQRIVNYFEQTMIQKGIH